MSDDIELQTLNDYQTNDSEASGMLEGAIPLEDKELTKDEFLRLEEEKRRHEIDSKVAYRNMFEWYIIRLKFQKNKRLMYGLLLLWLVGIVLFMAIVSMIRKTAASYHLVNAINEAFIQEEWYFEDFEFPKRYGDMDNYWFHGPFVGNLKTFTEKEQVAVFGANRLLGNVMVRTHRVDKGKHCKINKHMALVMSVEKDENGDPIPSTDCYPEFSTKTQSKEPYGPDNMWTFETHDSPTVKGYIGSYGGDGFYIKLSYDPMIAQEQIAFLEENDWIDDQTRAVVLSINTFNPNLNFFTSTVLVTEFSIGGGCMNYYYIRPFRAGYYVSYDDYVRLGLEIVFAIWLLTQIVIHANVILSEIRLGHNIIHWLCNPLWNTVGIISIIMHLISTIWYIYMAVRIHKFVEDIKDIEDTKYFEKMERYGVDSANWVYFTAFTVMVGIFCTFRFLAFNRRFSIMWLTISRAGIDLFFFILLFGIVFIGFICVASEIYGAQLFQFSTAIQAIMTTLRGVFGDLDYDEMFRVQRYATPAYYVIFSVIVIFILMNMFIAIISDAYADVNNEGQDEEEQKITFRQHVKKMWRTVQRKIRGILNPEDREPSISSQQLLELLKKTRRKVGEKGFTKQDLADCSGFQDMPEDTFDDVWETLVLQTRPNKTERQPMGFGEPNSDDEAAMEEEELEKENGNDS